MLSSSTRGRNDGPERSPPRSRPDSATVSPPMRCVASVSASSSTSTNEPRRPGRAHRVLRRRELHQRSRASSLAASASPSRSRGGTPRHPAPASARRTGRAHTARAPPTGRRRTAGRRGWTASAVAGSAPVDEPSPCAADPPPSGRRTSSSLLLRSADGSRPRPGFRRAVDDRWISSRRRSRPASRWPRRIAAASTFGPIDPAANCSSRSSSGVTRASCVARGCPSRCRRRRRRWP